MADRFKEIVTTDGTNATWGIVPYTGETAGTPAIQVKDNGEITGTSVTTTGEANKLVKTDASGNVSLNTGGTNIIKLNTSGKSIDFAGVTTTANTDFFGIKFKNAFSNAAVNKAGIYATTDTTVHTGRLEFRTSQDGNEATTKLRIATNITAKAAFSVQNDADVNVFSVNPANKAVTVTALVGIGNRAVYSDATGTLTNSSSDERVKKNVTNLSDKIDVLSSLKNIRGVTYNWDNKIEGYENMGEQEEIGVIAQEIEQYIPQIVGENSTGYKSVDYAKLTAFLIEVNKELLKRVEALENKAV